MEDFRRERGLDFNARTAVMSLFGMINWIYTWYNPRVDGNAEALAQQMGDIVLNGIVRSGKRPLKGATDFDGATASLKRCPDTNSNFTEFCGPYKEQSMATLTTMQPATGETTKQLINYRTDARRGRDRDERSSGEHLHLRNEPPTRRGDPAGAHG